MDKLNKDFDLIQFIKIICSYSPRLGKNEQLTAKYIKSVLSKNNVKYRVQKFKSAVPIIQKATLKADGKSIKCRGSCLVSGKILHKENLISSHTYIDEDRTKSNINFNPYSKYISVVSYYKNPAIAIMNADINKIIKSKKIVGEVIVKKYNYYSENILVGNYTKPTFIVFAHYDCIGSGGAVDNASGVGAVMYTILKNPDLSNNVLFVFSGCEEISYDKFRSGGLGFRKFEQTFSKQIRCCKGIYVLDGVGNGSPHLTQDYNLLNITLQIKSLSKFKKKVYLMQGDLDKIDQVYHTDFDTVDKLKRNFLIESSNLLFKKLKSL
jgi:hypothetical protein